MAELAAVEACSEHPLGKVVSERFGKGLRASDVTIHQGMGISATVGGVRYFIGSRRMVQHALACPGPGTAAYFGWDGEVKGAMTFGDRIRPDAAELCRNLRQRGMRTMLLSGDSAAATESAAAAIGADEWKAEATSG